MPNPSDGATNATRTVVITSGDTNNGLGQVRLQLQARSSDDEQQDDHDNNNSGDRTRRHVAWTEDTVDNEFMNKKKSKICCIFTPQDPSLQELSDSDSGSESSSSSSSSSSSDSDSDSNDDKPKRSNGSDHNQQHGHNCDDHGHGHGHGLSRKARRRAKLNTKGSSKDKLPAPNAYEIQPKYGPAEQL